MSTDPIERLRVVPPTLEPDPVLLDRLVAARTAGGPARPVLPRVMLAAAGVAAIAVTAWGITQLPDGGDSPGPAVHSVSPSPSPDRQGAPSPTQGASPGSGAAVTLPGTAAPGSTGSTDKLPGRAGSSPAVGSSGHSGSTPPAAGASDPASSAPGDGDRQGNGRGRSGDNPGKHLAKGKGHRPKPGKDAQDQGGDSQGKAGTTTQ